MSEAFRTNPTSAGFDCGGRVMPQLTPEVDRLQAGCGPSLRGMKQRAAIFGCGYVGSGVATRLRNEGWSVTAFTRNPERCAVLAKMGCEVVSDDICVSGWQRNIDGPFDLVLNAISASSHGPEGYRRAYIGSHEQLLEWAQQGAVLRRYVYTSSTGVYPDRQGDWVTEADADPSASQSASILLEAEQHAAELGGNCESGWAVLRLAGIYGPGRQFLADRIQSSRGVLPGVGDYYVNLIHLKDIVSAVMAVLNGLTPRFSGVYNVADGSPATKVDIADWLAERLGVGPIRFDPAAGTARSLLRTGPGGRPPNRRIDATRFRTTFGWAPEVSNFRAGYAVESNFLS